MLVYLYGCFLGGLDYHSKGSKMKLAHTISLVVFLIMVLSLFFGLQATVQRVTLLILAGLNALIYTPVRAKS